MMDGPEYTVDWTTHHHDLWLKHLAQLIGLPISMLEIGSYEGRSAIWFLEHILTNPTSTITCIDTFTGSREHEDTDFTAVEQRFDTNLERFNSQVTKLKGTSSDIARTLPTSVYDIIYIDGSHDASDVLTDAVLCWRLAKPGAVIIFDDYEWEPGGPKIGVNAFMSAFSGLFTMLHQGYQVIIKKQ